jgi:hypothetical protein
MRAALIAVLGWLAACNQLLGIDDPPTGGDVCRGACQCRVDDDCGSHEFCNDQVTSRTCECAAGYARGDAGCAWKGVVADPGFQDPSSWAPRDMATVDTAALTLDQKDPGVLRLPAAACSAVAAQRVTMPRLARAQPLVASITYRAAGAMSPQLQRAAPAFQIGQTWDENMPVALATQWTTVRRCLGAGHYAAADSTGPGEEIQLSVGRTLDSFCEQATAEIDRFEALPADPTECPPPGEVVNGQAELDGGWTFTGNSGGSSAFIAGAGENGSRGGRMTLSQRCASASVDVPLSPGVADKNSSPSLSYYVSSTANTSTYGSFGPYSLPAVPANQANIVRFCLPAHMRGTPDRLRMTSSYNSGTGACTDPVTASAVLDSVKLENLPACGTSPWIADPGFESGFLFESYGSEAGAIRSVEDTTAAHSGTHALELKLGTCTGYAYTYVHVVAPPADGGAGPALAFWSRMSVGTNTSLRVYRTSGSLNVPIPRDTQWRRGVICLDPKRAGRHQSLYFYFSATCTVDYPAESAFIDDLEVTVDPSCPAT